MSENLPKTTTPTTSILSVVKREEQTPVGLQEISSADWTPFFSIAYGLSQCVQDGNGKPGDFMLGKETSFGKKVKVICVDYRYHALVFNKDMQQSEGDIYVDSSWTRPLSENEAYSNFVSQNLTPACTLNEGADLFLYIPSANSFAVFFCKNTLARYAKEIFEASKGGRVVELETVPATNKSGGRKWYNIKVIKTTEAVTGSELEGIDNYVNVPETMFHKHYTMFKNPRKGLEVASSEEAPERDR